MYVAKFLEKNNHKILTNEGIAKLPGSEKSMILSCFAESEGPFSSTFGHIFDKVGLKCGAAKQLKRAILMSSRVLQFPLKRMALEGLDPNEIERLTFDF